METFSAGATAEDRDVEEVIHGRGELCRRVLEALPDWFGIPEAIDEYVREVESRPTFAICAGGERVGLVAVKEHSVQTAEILVMGVLPSHHRGGLGRRLVAAAERYAASRGACLLTVKTLSPARENRAYAETRAFYRAVGFFAVEEFPTLWDPANPCLMMAKLI